ncbi:deoxyribonuclease V [Ketobacter sp.]|uniref:deoxyribonuclease V n=1 Tax=Ketobacter sp. TaxID=2083498 RepID=UPI000F24316F|nr:deoxyribonuclease V [Ketobacter sp.]RLT98072.1 MAG: deoxyribonuclease V [Ketobacter sp.]
MQHHAWDLTPKQAIQVQHQWRQRVVTEDQFGPVTTVAGVDVGFEQAGSVTRAAIVVLNASDLQPVDSALVKIPTSYPYIPGLLSFREMPAILQAFEQLKTRPDLILCDGQGTAHPRRFGIACHLGVWLDLPAIGVGKTRLVGQHVEPPDERGAWVPLQDKGETVGAVLRSRRGVKPLYVSPGHRVSLASAVHWVMHCVTRYKLPETTRQAHHLASNLK